MNFGWRADDDDEKFELKMVTAPHGSDKLIPMLQRAFCPDM
jgi:hypothetical protein